MLECHVKNYLAINHTKSVLLPEKNEYFNFQNFKRLTKAPFISYCGFECALIPPTDNIDFLPNKKKYQYHIVWSDGYKLIYVDGGCNKLYTITLVKMLLNIFKWYDKRKYMLF